MRLRMTRLFSMGAAFALAVGFLSVPLGTSAVAGPTDPADHAGWYRPLDISFHVTHDRLGGAPINEYKCGAQGTVDAIPVVGDWDGNGTDTVGWYRASDASWHLTNHVLCTTGSSYTFVFGPAGDKSIIPIAGDWNGDGKDSVGWYRPVDISFHLTDVLTGGAPNNEFKFGAQGTVDGKPVTGDWNGDGRDSVGWYRGSDVSWHLTNTNAAGASDYTFNLGPKPNPGVKPVVGDWNGDGIDTAGWYRASDASWHVTDNQSGVGGNYAFVYGDPGNNTVFPLVGDWDGSTKPAPPPAPTNPAAKAIQYAREQIGKPYLLGGVGPASFDCSGLTYMAMRTAGLTMPRSANAQYVAYAKVPYASRKAGDLLFWDYDGGGTIDHVALYIGSNQIIEAPSPGQVVRVRTITSIDNLKNMVGRPLG